MTGLLDDLATDIGRFYDADVSWAETVTGPAGALMGIFDREYLESDPGGSAYVMSSEPVLRVQEADALAIGDAVTVRTIGYTVVEVMPDGNGETLLRLQLS